MEAFLLKRGLSGKGAQLHRVEDTNSQGLVGGKLQGMISTYIIECIRNQVDQTWVSLEK
jgi:hypothetical protein